MCALLSLVFLCLSPLHSHRTQQSAVRRSCSLCAQPSLYCTSFSICLHARFAPRTWYALACTPACCARSDTMSCGGTLCVPDFLKCRLCGKRTVAPSQRDANLCCKCASTLSVNDGPLAKCSA